MNRIARHAFCLTVSALLVALALTGCKGTTKSGTSYTQLPTRELQTMLPESLPTVHEHAVKVLKEDFGYTITSEAHDALEGEIKAKTARGHNVEIEVFKESDKVTKVQVFAGPAGNEDRAREILSAIEDSLND